MKTIPFINPATHEQFGAVEMATAADVHAAREALRGPAKIWRRVPVKARARILKKLQKVILDNLDEITAVITQDHGKSRQDSLIEVFLAVDKLHTYIRNVPKWLRRKRVPPGLYIFNRYYTEPQAYGVVGIMCPWNYPFELTLMPMVSALLAGNAVMVKPSEATPAVGVMLEKLVQSVPELSPYVRFLHGDGSVGAAIVDSLPDLLFLTGSTATAKKIAQKTAATLTPFLHELGGKDPLIVLEDADIDAAAKWACWGAFYNAGQTCMAVERVYAVAPVYDAFVAAVIKETALLTTAYDAGLYTKHNYGPVTFPRQLDIISAHIKDAQEKGAVVLAGGTRKDAFVDATVIVNVTHDMDLMRDETFGPIIPIMKVQDEAEAIAMANDSVYGLSASVWSRNIARAERVAQQLEVGSVNINDSLSHYAISQLPFGGVKQSGNARTHGELEVMQFTLPRSIAAGRAPAALDIATRLREPGHYRLASGILRVVFGATLQQRVAPLVEYFADKHGGGEPAGVDTPAAARLSKNGKAAAGVVGAMVAGAAFLFSMARSRR